MPFGSESDLPESLKPFIATAEAPPPEPVERNIYSSWRAARQVDRLAKGIALQEAAEEIASEPLPEDVQAALEAEHNIAIGRAKAEAEYRQGLADATYKQIEEEAAAKVTQYFVRRGGEWARVQNARLKPGETAFVRRENGQMEAAGTVNAAGEPPPAEVTP